MYAGRDLYLSRHIYWVLRNMTGGSWYLSLVANPGKDVFNISLKLNFMTSRKRLNEMHFRSSSIPPSQPTKPKASVLSNPRDFSHPGLTDRIPALPLGRSGQAAKCRHSQYCHFLTWLTQTLCQHPQKTQSYRQISTDSQGLYHLSSFAL